MDNYVVVTGGTGFIGSHLLDRLLSEDRKVILFKRSTSNLWRIKHLLDNSNLILVDVDKNDLKDTFEKYEIEGIYHLATYYVKFHEYDDIIPSIQSNIEFATILLDNAVKFGVKYFLSTGTFSEYSQENLPITEKSGVKAANLYSATKLAFEEILKYYQQNSSLKATTLKLFTPFGPRDEESKLIPYLIINGLKGEEIILKTPEQAMDVVYVKDIVDAFVKIGDCYSIWDDDYIDVNIATGKTYKVGEIYQIIKSYIQGESCSIEQTDLIFANPQKAKDKFNWESKTNLVDAIEETIDFYKDKYGL